MGDGYGKKKIFDMPCVIGHKWKINGEWFLGRYFREPRIYKGMETKKYADICLDYAKTVYCAQGRTMNKITFSIDEMSINLFYVALSRCVDINNIYLNEKVKCVEHPVLHTTYQKNIF